jgi:hypothetical protein
MARVKIELDTKRLSRRTGEFPRQVKKAVEHTVDYGAAYGTGYIKAHAPWTDDTGAARSGLSATPIHHKNASEVLLAYSVFYGIWLEIANSGRYAILIPAMRIVGEKIMADIQTVLSRMG